MEGEDENTAMAMRLESLDLQATMLLQQIDEGMFAFVPTSTLPLIPVLCY